MAFVNFVLVYFFLVFSVIGYGNFFAKKISSYNQNSNIGYLGLYGIFILTFLSYLTNLFFKHDYAHNYIIIIIGIFLFGQFIYSLKNLRKSKDLKYLCFFLILSLFSVLYFKSHDDFLYYHLSLTHNITLNKVEFGIGVFDLAFNHISSLFFFHSLFKLPFTGDYFYFVGQSMILIFTNIILIKSIFESKRGIISFNIFFNISIFVFINIFFYRLAEHGTDRSAIILILLTISLIFQIFVKKKIDKTQFENIILLLTFIITLKSFYAIYGLLFIAIFLRYYSVRRFLDFYQSFRIINLSIIFAILMLFYNVAYTGCFIYPLTFSCLEQFYWGMEISTINQAADFYELWSKAGATPNYKVDNPDVYIQGLNWLSNWINNYFFNKVSDTILGLIILSVIFFMVFRPSKIRINYPKEYNIIFFILLLFLVEWFLNHPSLRYGGYHLLALIFLIPLSIILMNNKFNFKKNLVKIKIIIIISIVIFLGRNINRIQNEHHVYNYNFFKSPHYKLDKKDYVLQDRKNNVLKKTNYCRNSLKKDHSCLIKNSYRIFYLNKLD